MDTTPLKKYFFAGATASLALIFVVWHIGYTAGLQKSTAPQVVQGQLLSDTATATTISGRITDIEGTTFTIVTPDSTPATRRVITDQGTLFGLSALKDQRTFQSEIFAFNAESKEAQANGTPVASAYPTPFALKTIPFTDLRKGDVVTITAIGPVFSKSEFTAMKVIVESRAL